VRGLRVVVDQVEEEEEEEERSTPGHPRPLLPVEEWRWLLRLGVCLQSTSEKEDFELGEEKEEKCSNFFSKFVLNELALASTPISAYSNDFSPTN